MRRYLGSATFLGLVGTGVFFVSWELLSHSGLVNEVMLPAPTSIGLTAFRMIETGELVRHLWASIWRASVGYVIGTALAICLGVMMAQLRMVDRLLNPLLQMFRAVPSLAFVPLAIFWFGVGEISKIFLIAWGVFFPVWVSTYVGVRDTSPLLLRAAESLGAQGWRNLVFVVLPGALPLILTGMRVSLSVALVVLVAAELAGAVFGVGYLIQMSQQVFRVDQMFVGLICLGLLGFGADQIFELLIGKWFPWYGADRALMEGRQRK